MARDLGAQMILAEWLFVETVADVRNRSQDPRSRSRYELLGIAPLLRKLLFDGTAVVDTVRTARPEIPTDFRIRPWQAPDQDVDDLRYVLRLGGPELVGGPDDIHLSTVAEFASAQVGLVDGEALTVRQVVRYYANVEGGVHFGVPKENGQETMNMMAPLLLGNTTGQIEILANIGQIVVAALTPLCNSILTMPTILAGVHLHNEAGLLDNHWTSVH
jgi:hypothetical protein